MIFLKRGSKVLLIVSLLFAGGLFLTSCGGYIAPPIANQPPVAVITADPTSAETPPLTVQFDGSGSYDPDGNIVSYQWDFGDGTSGSGVATSHTYTKAGEFTATLTVTDNEGTTGTASVIITIRCDVIHEGDLVISGDEVFTIQNVTYCQEGTINLHERASIVMNNGKLIFICPGDCYLNLYDNTTAQLNQSLLSDVHVHVHNNAVLEIIGSAFEEGGIRLFGPETGAVQLNVTRSLLSRLELWPASPASGSCSSIRPGHIEDWNFRRDCQVDNPSIEIQLFDTTVSSIGGSGWAFVLTGKASFSFDDSNIGIVHVFDRAAAIITNSTLNSARLDFHAGQTVTLKGLRWGFIPYWSLRDLNPSIEQSFVVQNSEVVHVGWDISAAGSDVIVSDSELGRFMPSYGTFARVRRSAIDVFSLGQGEGTVIFEDVVVKFMPNPTNSIFRLEGTVNFIEEEMHGNWQNSTITREFPVLVQDSSGSPLPNVDLELYSPQGDLLWSGKSDSEGKASFEIVFDDNNYDKTWTLKAPALGVEKEVRFLTDTPIVVTAP